MIVAIASGKGGTGKTTVAVSLALSLLPSRPTFVDCDVEEPNAALFIQPDLDERQDVALMIPEVDIEACTHCGRCAEVCQYNAIAALPDKVLVFPEVCHGCGSCTLNCPAGAIHEVSQPIGTVERGWAGQLEFAQGTMDVGQALPVPIIRQLKHWMFADCCATYSGATYSGGADGGGDDCCTLGTRPIILDAPPGTACPVVATMSGADAVLLVTEPTPFGLHDLRLAVEVARDELRLPVAVVVNRTGVGDRGVEAYCAAKEIPILMQIPLDRRIAEAYSEGIPLVDAVPGYRKQFVALWQNLVELL
jgi:MinD superfamily P-loop ATPase